MKTQTILIIAASAAVLYYYYNKQKVAVAEKKVAVDAPPGAVKGEAIRVPAAQTRNQLVADQPAAYNDVFGTWRTFWPGPAQ